MASTRKSIYINPTLTVYYTAFLNGDVIIQARESFSPVPFILSPNHPDTLS